jgi:Protein tyrosine and serine/threonine kinase
MTACEDSSVPQVAKLMELLRHTSSIDDEMACSSSQSTFSIKDESNNHCSDGKQWSNLSQRMMGRFVVLFAFLLISAAIFIHPSLEWQGQCFYQPFSFMRGLRQSFPTDGIRMYLTLFDRKFENYMNSSTTWSRRNADSGRRLSLVQLDPPSAKNSPTLVIAGKMTVEGGPCNIAQYNLKTGEWSLSERIQLSLYNSYSGGEVYSLLANHTYSTSLSTSTSAGSSPSIKRQSGSGELLVVGAFDTTYRNSQVTYCSVGMWDGAQLSKVGEGLCNSALSKGMKITTASLAGPQDVYVAGSFQTQVWNGDRHEFVQIFNIAHFNAADQVWLPLNVGQISCSWCTVTVLALAWDRKRRQLHVAGKFNAIDGRNVPAGLAIYDYDSGHLVAHPGGGLSMRNISQDGVGTALQLDEDSDVLYVMGSFERLTQTYEFCDGLAAYEIEANRWTCLADAEHSVRPTGGGNMLLTPFGLMVAGKTTPSTTWRNSDRPYTIALLNATLVTKKKETRSSSDDDRVVIEEHSYHDFNWSWLPGFSGHEEPLHALSNGFGNFEGSVFIAGDNLVARWYHQPVSVSSENSNQVDTHDGSVDEKSSGRHLIGDPRINSPPRLVPKTINLNGDSVRGAVMAISQMEPEDDFNEFEGVTSIPLNIQIIVYCVCLGAILGVLGAILCNKNIAGALFPIGNNDKGLKGFTLDTLTYSAMENTSMVEAYNRAMHTRYVHHPNLLTVIDPQEIFLQRIIGHGTFGRVWSARWRTASVAVKEFVFAQAAVAGKSSMQQKIVEEIIGEAGMMAILRHPNVLQLFGCSLTAQAIWIVSELCSLGSLRQMLDDNDRVLPVDVRLNLALQVAEGMTYLHNQKIIHRDLKSLNIFVHETFIASDDVSLSSKRADGSERMETHSTYVAKIGDWGSARATMSGSRTMTHGVGTACW